jgi:primosomal protein N' (replication factor Y)
MSNLSKQIYQIIPAVKMDKAFDYLGLDEKLNIGDIVEIEFGRQKVLGVIIGVKDNSDFKKLKPIQRHLSEYGLSKQLIEFLNFFSKYNLASIGMVYKMVINNFAEISQLQSLISIAKAPEKITSKRQLILDYLQNKTQEDLETLVNELDVSRAYIREQVKKGFLKEEQKTIQFNYQKQEFTFNPPKLSNAQIGSLAELTQIFQTNKTNISVLNGVTGSGKTEIYLEYIRTKLTSSSGQIIILVPEIILTKQLHEKIKNRFNIDVPIWHSLTPKKQKEKIISGINSGNIRLIIGTRSLLMLPFKKLDLIIIDEEHDTSYKQEEIVIYHARDMAVARAKFEDAEVILTSATPSLESLVNCDLGKYHKIDLATRFNESAMPKINLIDMTNEQLKPNHFISDPAIKAIRAVLSKGEQSLIYLNRRGFAPIKICNNCGHKFECPNCAIYLVEHRKTKKLHCHHCEYHEPIPDSCPKCHHPDLVAFGPGIERIHEEVVKIFPDKKSVIISAETSEKDFAEIIQQMQQKQIDIIIGTQIIAKGHHFPELTNVTVIDGDLNSNEINNLRCSEKLYQLLNQIAGRAGREAKAGEVYIQSFDPKHPLLEAIQNYDANGLIEFEKTQRKNFDLPPYSKFLAIIISNHNENEAKETANQIAFNLPQFKDVKILGPIPAPIYFLRGKYRFRILIKYKTGKNIQQMLRDFFAKFKPKSTTSIKLDVDPYNFF